jgi:predicted nucleic acid-binding protein
MTEGHDDRILVDTSVLVSATDQTRARSVACTDFLESTAGLRVSAQVLREYAVVATRPVVVNGLGLSVAQALENIEAICHVAALLPEDEPVHEALVELLRLHPVKGKRIHDANLVATAWVHRLTHVATLNARDFEAFEDVVAIISPGED